MTRQKSRLLTRVVAAAALTGGMVAGTAMAASALTSKPASTHFSLFPAVKNVPCLQASTNPARQPTVRADVQRGKLNDTMDLHLRNFKPGLDFDLFTVQNSNQNADGTPVDPAPSFGLAWYQSDIHVNKYGRADVRIRTILLDQIFGFDPIVTLAPTNTFHVGFWFNNPADAANCGFTGTTPFNGEHAAGPLAFITRPNATSGLGPLCTDPTDQSGTFACNP